MTNSIEIVEVDRTTLYYNKYDTRLRLAVPGIGFTRYYSSAEQLWIRVLEEKDHYDSNGYRIRSSLFTPVPSPLSQLNKTQCYKLIEIAQAFNQLTQTNDKVKIVNQSNSLFAYFNLADIGILQAVTIVADQCQAPITLAEHITEVHPEVKYTSDPPRHQYRLYARELRLEDSVKFREDLLGFLKKHENILFPSAAFWVWLKDQGGPANFYYWTHSHIKSTYYIDFDNPSSHILIALAYPELAGKKYQLVHRT
jgi:hypothetical protein